MLSSIHWTAIAAFGLSTTVHALNSSQPIVDLGYELHQGSFNSSGGYYNFSNIRYAAPPIGELRFTAPQSPAVNRSHVQTGNVERICPQAITSWIGDIVPEFIPAYLSGQTVFNASSFPSSSSNTSTTPAIDPRTDEDCLFLDVVVPKDIFLSNQSHPVLVWIYGGGYTSGSKSDSGNPAGLIARSENNNSSGVIYVAMNYRLGAFGWLSGPTFQQNGTANAGLYDQRFALEWVQRNIHLFGGDPERVTVFGESAGGGSIEHQITAYGGNLGPAPFSQAVLQSPAWFPIVSASEQEGIFDDFLSLLNVSTLEEARNLPSSVLQQANTNQVMNSTYGQFTFGPAVDGNFVPALPGQLLERGQFDKSVRVMTGHNTNEGLIFTSPFVQNDTDLENYLILQLPTLAALPDTLSYIVNTLYPPIFDGSQAQNYTSQIGRAEAIISELVFTCNTVYVQKAYENKTHGYIFDVPPSLHGQDIAYTYYNGNGNTEAAGTAAGGSYGVSSVQVAYELQDYITQFAKTGDPNGNGAPFFPTYGNNATVQILGANSTAPGYDTTTYRCAWWQKGLWY